MTDAQLIKAARGIRRQNYGGEVWIARSIAGWLQAAKVAHALGLYCVELGPRSHFLLTPNRYSPPDESGYPKTHTLPDWARDVPPKGGES